MILKLNYFGMVAEAVGKEEELYDFSNRTVEELNQQLKERYANLGELSYNFAINHSIVENSHVLNEQDEIALLPPFAGG